ncbi:Protein UPS2, mitochondrial [Cyberlindnera fabianii]|uniref:Protein UPS2, mitochondrial n=1 Tax=Cyberlindnera fabianii TaxID=36022 RepID=A0A1V2L8I5_CYBFA|nr:Protein UPS2, mitochondrial [Cyberlindnera fabianii]
MSTQVVAVDVLRRELQSNKLITERLIKCEQSVPGWIKTIIGGCTVSYVREVSTVDLDTRTLTLRSVNLTMSNLLRVYETVTYTPHETDPSRTVFSQEAQITAYASWSRLCSKIEEWSVERFGENAKKGRIGFESVLELFNEQWSRKEQLVDEISQELSVSIEKVKTELVKTMDDESLDSLDKVKTEIVKETDQLLEKAVKETDRLLQEVGDVESVKKSIVTQYYDMIKKAFKGE